MKGPWFFVLNQMKRQVSHLDDSNIKLNSAAMEVNDHIRMNLRIILAVDEAYG